MIRPVLVLGIALACCVAQDEDPRAWIARGTEAFKAARYAEAARDFEQALVINPESVHARQYLAVSYAVQYIPGAKTPDNAAYLAKARANFEKILELDPKNHTAVQYLASLSMQEAAGIESPADKRAKFEEARKWYDRLAGIEPLNKEAPYNIGVIDWQEAYPEWLQARADAGMKRKDAEEAGPITNQAIRARLRTDAGPLWDDAVRQLQRALDIDPQYEEAMAYMNLVVRERADLADSPEEYARQIADADAWVRKDLETKRARAVANQPSGERSGEQ